MTESSLTKSGSETSANPFDAYKFRAVLGLGAAAAYTLINPISGAAIGTYCIVEIVTSVAVNALGTNKGTATKVAAAVLPCLAGFGAGIGVVSRALGETFTFTPLNIGLFIGTVAMNILGSLR